ncbi:MAG: SirB2 family protein [Burkholderiaceae bacterium]
MLEYFLPIKHTHIALALLSGCLFALRGAGALRGQTWPYRDAVRFTSYGIDTALLTVALMLVSLLPHEVFANGWLFAKLGLLVVYIVLGVLALRRTRSPKARALAYAGAILVFGMMYSIARAHHPLGWFAQWIG